MVILNTFLILSYVIYDFPEKECYLHLICTRVPIIILHLTSIKIDDRFGTVQILKLEASTWCA